MTNLNKTKEEIIYEILLSLNKGNCGYSDDRVRLAIQQYNSLVNKGLLREQ